MLAEEILKKRRDRAIAIVLTVKERDIDPLLKQVQGGDRASVKLRKVVLDQVNDFYDMALDVAMSGEAAGFEFNADVWEQRFDRLEAILVNGDAANVAEPTAVQE